MMNKLIYLLINNFNFFYIKVPFLCKMLSLKFFFYYPSILVFFVNSNLKNPGASYAPVRLIGREIRYLEGADR
jgi:hypothetical protein